jgi:hypothetical protein
MIIRMALLRGWLTFIAGVSTVSMPGQFLPAARFNQSGAVARYGQALNLVQRLHT